MTPLSAAGSLGRILVVRQGYLPLARLLGPAVPAEGLFDSLVARFDGRDLRVHAFLGDLGGPPDAADFRCAALRRGLQGLEATVRGRILATVWVLSADAKRAAELATALLGPADGHFLSQTLVGRGVLSLDGPVHYDGRVAPQPSAAQLGAWAADPAADPGEAAVGLALESRDRDERQARRLLQPGPASLTRALIAANAAVFAIQMAWFKLLDGHAVDSLGAGLDELLRWLFLPGASGMEVMLRLGANDPALTLGQHQWWRLLACAFVHANILHIGMNMMALFSLGALVERLAGPARLALVYLLSALGAGLVSALLHQASGLPSVGASGAILGLAGLLLAPRWRRDPRFPQGLALRLHQWLGRSLLLIFGLGLLFKVLDLPIQFDNAAHIGGLLTGFTLGYLWPSFLVRSGPWKG